MPSFRKTPCPGPCLSDLRKGKGTSKGKVWMQGFVAAAIQLVAFAASACPTCSEAIKDDPAALAFQWSTLFMIAMPYLLVGSVGGGLAYVYWNAARSAAAESGSTEIMSWPSKGPERGGGQ